MFGKNLDDLIFKYNTDSRYYTYNFDGKVSSDERTYNGKMLYMLDCKKANASITVECNNVPTYVGVGAENAKEVLSEGWSLRETTLDYTGKA